VAAARPRVEGRPGPDGRQTARGRRTRRPLGGHRAGRPCRGRAGTPAQPGAAVPRRAVPRVKGRPPLQRPTRHGPHPQDVAEAIARFVAWVNADCQANQRHHEQIPPDPSGRPLAPSRLRRTLAWFIVRRPRGLVAGAIQYGHVQVQVTPRLLRHLRLRVPRRARLRDLAAAVGAARRRPAAPGRRRARQRPRRRPLPRAHPARQPAVCRSGAYLHPPGPRPARQPRPATLPGQSHDLRVRSRQGQVPPAAQRRRRPPHPQPLRLPARLSEHRPHRPGHHRAAPPKRQNSPCSSTTRSAPRPAISGNAMRCSG
jgi:hypothetical protein